LGINEKFWDQMYELLKDRYDYDKIIESITAARIMYFKSTSFYIVIVNILIVKG